MISVNSTTNLQQAISGAIDGQQMRYGTRFGFAQGDYVLTDTLEIGSCLGLDVDAEVPIRTRIIWNGPPNKPVIRRSGGLASASSTSKVPVKGEGAEAISPTFALTVSPGSASSTNSAGSPGEMRTTSRSVTEARMIQPFSLELSTSTGIPAPTSSLSEAKRFRIRPEVGATIVA